MQIQLLLNSSINLFLLNIGTIVARDVDGEVKGALDVSVVVGVEDLLLDGSGIGAPEDVQKLLKLSAVVEVLFVVEHDVSSLVIRKSISHVLESLSFFTELVDHNLVTRVVDLEDQVSVGRLHFEASECVDDSFVELDMRLHDYL